MPIKEIGRKHGFSDASFYKWRAKYGRMDVSEAKRLRALELSGRQACALVGQSHDTYQNIPQLSALNAELLGKIIETAHTRRR